MLFRTRDEKRISLISTAILLTLILAAGLSVYAVMHRQAEAQISRSLQQNVESRARMVEREIRQHLTNAAAVSNRASLQGQLLSLAKQPENETAKQDVALALRGFLPLGFNALVIYDPAGREWVRAGPDDFRPELSVRLNLPYRTNLEWDGGLVLTTKLEIFSAGRPLGVLVAVRRLPEVLGLITDLKSVGESAELHLCGPENSQFAACFPTKNSPQITLHRPLKQAGELTPMGHALAGSSGYVANSESQGARRIATYVPVGDIGLGMVLF